MTAGVAVALAAAGGLAAADWAAVVARRKPLEYVFKPAVLGALLVVALVLQPDDAGQRAWFVAALVLSLAGDVFLMLPGDRFVPGLASFLAGHLAYTAGLSREVHSGAGLAVGALVVMAVAVPLAARILGAVRRGEHPGLAGPVGAYVLVISTMVATATATGDPRAAVGAWLFYASDALIAWNRFVRPFGWALLAIIVTYHVGQALLVLSLT